MIESKELSWRRGQRHFEQVHGLPGHCPPQAAGGGLNKNSLNRYHDGENHEACDKKRGSNEGELDSIWRGKEGCYDEIIEKNFIKQGI